MEVKERYKLESYLEAFCEIHDTESDEWYLRKDLVTDLLNRQDTRIKELEEENGYIIFADGYDENGNEVDKQIYTTYKSKCDELIKENQQFKEELKDIKNNYRIQIDSLLLVRLNLFKQLKQSQKQLAIEVLEKFKSELVNKISPIQLSYTNYVKQVYDKINNQIKELKGEK